MKEHPILFSGPMVRAILEGRKTQTRRVVKPQPTPYGEDSPFALATQKQHIGKPWMPVGGVFQENWQCPFGAVGDRLWVRETWCCRDLWDGLKPSELGKQTSTFQIALDYKANNKRVWSRGNQGKWRPSIHMPRWASRLTLEITAVRVERLQEISEDDAVKEGAPEQRHPYNGSTTPASYRWHGFRELWSKIHSPELWAANPWVWVIEFRKVEEEVK